jgi:hypothetical protein
VSSVSWFGDYQARRANIRYRPAEGKGTEVVHTVNGSAMAVAPGVGRRSSRPIGYRIVPDEFEFWQGRPNRLHDRFRYLPDGAGSWRIDRLSP